jgi:predicted ATPase
MLAARIDRLSPDDKRLLQTASVVGKDVPFTLLEAITDTPADTLRGTLGRLQAAEFFYEKALFPDLEYTFKHALTHEVAYGSLLQERRRVLHAHIMEVIETLYQDRLGEHVERLAHHASRGGVLEKTFVYSRDCGDKAVSRSANREAAIYFEEALAAVQRLPESRDRIEQAFDLRLDLRRAHFANADLDKARIDLDEAEVLAHRLGDERRLARLSYSRAMDLWATGDHRQVIVLASSALDVGLASDDVAIQARAREILGRGYHIAGNYLAAVSILRDNVASLTADLARQGFGMAGFVSVHSLSYAARCLAELGRFAEGEG